MQEKEIKLRKYLTERVNPILEKLIMDLLVDTPEQIVKNYFYSKDRLSSWLAQ